MTGSDIDAYPPMSDQLAAAGIEVQKGFAAEHVLSNRPDLVVIGNAVRRDNPEARAAIDGGLPYLSFRDAIHHFFLRGKHSVVIAGTHGKTTTHQHRRLDPHARGPRSVGADRRRGRELRRQLPARRRARTS